jgi:hypothetical protein
MDSYKYYTGVGSRSTPENIMNVMGKLAKVLAYNGWTVRSGGAIGADRAFEAGAIAVGGGREIYFARDANAAAMEMASKIHPAWNKCNDYVKKLHARNCFQVLGKDLKTPSSFLVCWTPDGADVGGTRTAIVLARNNNIEVINMGLKHQLDRIVQYIGK